MCDVFLPDMFVDVPGPLQDVGQCEAGGSDTADDGPSHNVIGVVGQVVQVGLEKITNLTQIIKVHILWFVIPSSKMLTKIIFFEGMSYIAKVIFLMHSDQKIPSLLMSLSITFFF